MDYLQNYLDNLALEKFKKGEGSGPISKLISIISLHSLVLIIAVLFNEKQFIPLGIFLVLSFTPVGIWVSLALVIYFIIIKFWIGVVLIVLYAFFVWFSSWLGMRNIKKNLLSNKSTINPFEGIFELKVLTIAILTLFGLALITNGTLSVILWILYLIITFFLLIRLYTRIRTKWSQIHYSLMIRYASFSGLEAGTSESEKREFIIENPLVQLIQSAYAFADKDKARELFNQAKMKLDKFQDSKGFEKLLKRKNPNIDSLSLLNVLTKMEQLAKTGQNKLLVRYVIGEIVGNDFGDDERLKYLIATYMGEAT
jgi:hypothetical protein